MPADFWNFLCACVTTEEWTCYQPESRNECFDFNAPDVLPSGRILDVVTLVSATRPSAQLSLVNHVCRGLPFSQEVMTQESMRAVFGGVTHKKYHVCQDGVYTENCLFYTAAQLHYYLDHYAERLRQRVQRANGGNWLQLVHADICAFYNEVNDPAAIAALINGSDEISDGISDDMSDMSESMEPGEVAETAETTGVVEAVATRTRAQTTATVTVNLIPTTPVASRAAAMDGPLSTERSSHHRRAYF